MFAIVVWTIQDIISIGVLCICCAFLGCYYICKMIWSMIIRIKKLFGKE